MSSILGLKRALEPAIPKAAPSQKSQDSASGNGSTPGYDNIWKKPKGTDVSKKDNENESPLELVTTSESMQVNTASPTRSSAPPLRLQLGWDQLLVAQKKMCEKARGIMQALEAPARYFLERKSKMLNRKHNGVIVDFKSSEHVGAIDNLEQLEENQPKIDKVA